MVSVLWTAMTSAEFMGGLVPGLIGAVLAMAVGPVWRRQTGEPLGMVGVLFAFGVVWAVPTVRLIPNSVLLGLALLGLAGLLSSVLPSIAAQAVAALPGAWLVTADLDQESAWISWVLLGAIALGGPLVASSDRTLSRPLLGPIFFAVAVGGVYVNVPDTEEMLVLMGVMAPLALLGWPLNLARLGGVGSFMSVGALMWAAAWGGTGRAGSIVGAVACLGLLLVLPMITNPSKEPGERWPLLFGIHLAVVLVAGRVAGFRTDPVEASLIAFGALAVGLMAARTLLGGDEDQNWEQGPSDPATAPSSQPRPR